VFPLRSLVSPQVLRHHFPGTLLLPDVRAIQALPKVKFT